MPETLRAEMEGIKDKKDEIYDRFCRDIAFGTSGLRGKMGAGTNRINTIVIRRATKGVADYICSKYKTAKVIIGFDTRRNSREYAEEAAEVLSRYGIDVYVFDRPVPVPLVSFSIRRMSARAGIMITASHNPKEYNGYKVYDHFGNQIDDRKARLIEKYIGRHAYFEGKQNIADEPEDQAGLCEGKSPGEPGGEVRPWGEELYRDYIEAVKSQALYWSENEEEVKRALSDLKVVYTPLNGAGGSFALKIFQNLGVRNLTIVNEQWEQNGDFPTCPAPNPENEKTFEKALGYCAPDTDIIIATDPDSDRMGVMARKDGKFCRLTGDQAGILMLEYVCWCHGNRIGSKNMRGQKIVYKSFVSSPFAEDIARRYRVMVKNVPTGFKNIAFEMEQLKEAGREKDFLFGFEESLGYLYGDYTRDKDGILALQMICLMAACLKARGIGLWDKLEEMYRHYGYAESKAVSVEFHAEKDRKKIETLMDDLFHGKLSELMGEHLTVDASHCCEDMFRAFLPGGHQVIVRPSGTELKVKMYGFARGDSKQEALDNLDRLLKELYDFAVRYR